MFPLFIYSLQGAEATVQEEIHLTKVFIGGLPQEADVDSIAEFFSQFGPVSQYL